MADPHTVRVFIVQARRGSFAEANLSGAGGKKQNELLTSSSRLEIN
jgi:hypothetical protein